MRAPLCLFMLGIAMAVLACSHRSANESSEPAAAEAASSRALGRVHGVVSASLGKELIPLAGIQVALRRTAPERNVASVRTDETGVYKFSRIEPGDYRVCWDVPGYRRGCTEETIAVGGYTASAPDVQLQPDPARTVVSGRVVLADGAPCWFASELFGIAQNATVVPLDGERVAGPALSTNSNGEFVLAGLPKPGLQIRATCGNTSVTVPASQSASIKLPIGRGVPKNVNVSALLAGNSARVVRPGATVHLAAQLPAGATVQWKAVGAANDALSVSGQTAMFKAPAQPGRYSVYALGSDGKGDYGTGRVDIVVAPAGASFPSALLTHGTVGEIPTPGVPFLTKKGIGNSTVTQAYYKFIDPQSKRATLGGWWDTVGFAADGTGGDRVAYVNTNDLGFGRDMHCIERGKDVACYVTNYGDPNRDPANADLAWSQTAPAGATVAMEYSPIEGLVGVESAPVVKFFVYDLGATRASARIDGADLDGGGIKYVPQLCLNCHGGDYNPLTDPPAFDDVKIRASFREFDLPTFLYPTAAPRASQEATFFKLQQSVLATDPSKAITDLITGWYAAGTVADDSYVPTGWTLEASHQALYTTVVGASCRTCHIAFGGDAPNELSWMTYAQLQRKQSRAGADVCSRHTMPHARITFENFWTSSPSRADFFANFTASDWTALGTCQ